VSAQAPTRLGRLPVGFAGTRLAWKVLVAVVVLGIIGMHAIGLHGSQHAGPGALAAPTEMSVMAGHGAMAESHGQGDTAVMDQSEGTALVSPLTLGHGTAGMAMLCIAVLVGAALARMLIRSHRCSRVLLRDRVMASSRVVRRTDARQTGPPVGLAVSVIRC